MPVPQTYDFLVDTYGTERLKTLSVWSMFADADLAVRPHAVDRRPTLCMTYTRLSR